MILIGHNGRKSRYGHQFASYVDVLKKTDHMPTTKLTTMYSSNEFKSLAI